MLTKQEKLEETQPIKIEKLTNTNLCNQLVQIYSEIVFSGYVRYFSHQTKIPSLSDSSNIVYLYNKKSLKSMEIENLSFCTFQACPDMPDHVLTTDNDYYPWETQTI